MSDINYRALAFALFVMLAGIGVFVAGDAIRPPTQTDYEYTVKAEQVNEDEMVNSSTDYDNLSEPEQEVLHRAFKKSDHFLGGSEAYVETDEPINASSDWRVVEVQGVPLLVSISEPVPVEKTTDVTMNGVSTIVQIVGLVVAVLALALAIDITVGDPEFY